MTTRERITVIVVLALGAVLWTGCVRAPAPGGPTRERTRHCSRPGAPSTMATGCQQST